MARVSSSVKLNWSVIKRLDQAAIQALEKTGEWLHTEVIQATVMPRDTGTMQNESTFVDYSGSVRGSVALVTSTPYARRLYFNPESVHIHTEKNPAAKDHWLKEWDEESNGKRTDEVNKAYAKFYRRCAGT